MDSVSQNKADLAQAYDSLPYTSLVFNYSQPNRLYALAKMKGLNPAPLATAKVLEIGCSFGGNLLPFAIHYPNSQLVGIDLSEHQVQIGKQMMNAVGVENVELVAADISQVTFNCQFDYIICHGVLSWVPEKVQEAILNTVKNYLSPNGIAFISYNTYPGWKVKDIAKDLMLFGSNENLPVSQRIDQSFETLKFARNITNRLTSPIFEVMSNLFETVMDNPKYYIAHEHFESYNIPFYFKDFVAKIAQHQLAYVTDSSKPMIIPNFIFENGEFEKVSDFFNQRVENIEQFIDFIHCREFRTSIITHQQHLDSCGITNTIDQYLQCRDFYNLYFKASFEFVAQTDDRQAYWRVYQNAIEFVDTPLNNALFKYLQAQKEPCKVRDIIDYFEAQKHLSLDGLVDTLFIIVHSSNVYLGFEPEKHFSYQEKPELFEKYRKLIDFCHQNPHITREFNRYFQPIELDGFSKHLAPYLDGTRTEADLAKCMRQDIVEGKLLYFKDEVEVPHEQITDKEINDLIQQSLKMFDHYGYFIHYS